MELLKGVHRIPAYANSVLLVEDKILLIDATLEATAKPILDYLPKARVQPRDIAAIVITHTHPDHVKGLRALKGQAGGARVAAHEADADYVAKKLPYPHKPLEGQPSPWEAVPVDDRLQDGQRYEGLRVIHAPGHTPGSIALLDEERSLLIAGDTLNTDPGSGQVDPALGVGTMSDAYNADPALHRASIKKLAKHDFEALIVGHGEPVLRGAGAKVKALARKL